MQEWESPTEATPKYKHTLPLSSVTQPPSSMFIHTQIGWRRIRGSRHDIQQPKLVMVGNIIYPCIIFLLLAFVCVSQIVICFLRDQVCHSLHLQCHLSPPHLSTSTLPLSHPLSQQFAGVSQLYSTRREKSSKQAHLEFKVNVHIYEQHSCCLGIIIVVIT